MQGSWNNQAAYYRYVFLSQYAAKNTISRPRAWPNPKMGELPGARQRPAEHQRSRVWCCCWSGCGLEGDFVAEGLELADVRALPALGVDALVVEITAEIGVMGVGVRPLPSGVALIPTTGALMALPPMEP
ncbi:MAG: hypothetical protein M3Y33_01390 [Actinomycetota bacterium]|nr:hypothetical protein [Actinomycetota bacterium]